MAVIPTPDLAVPYEAPIQVKTMAAVQPMAPKNGCNQSLLASWSARVYRVSPIDRVWNGYHYCNTRGDYGRELMRRFCSCDRWWFARGLLLTAYTGLQTSLLALFSAEFHQCNASDAGAKSLRIRSPSRSKHPVAPRSSGSKPTRILKFPRSSSDGRFGSVRFGRG
jgi:hypothetical protein